MDQTLTLTLLKIIRVCYQESFYGNEDLFKTDSQIYGSQT